MSRSYLVAGNWKLHKTLAESRALATKVAALPASPRCEVVVAPPFTALDAVAQALKGSPVGLSAQDVYWENQGAFTGEVGPLQLADVGCRYGIIGHSERRALFGEKDEEIAKKLRALRAQGLAVILCVGETLEQRQAGETLAVVLGQLDAALQGCDAALLAGVVVAYEPVWAIGTGVTAKPGDAQEVHAAIRSRLQQGWGAEVAAGMRILYGGSVKADNAAELFAQVDIDGALVGGASLDADSFLSIVRSALEAPPAP